MHNDSSAQRLRTLPLAASDATTTHQTVCGLVVESCSRRALLSALAGAGAMALLSACGGADAVAPTPEGAVTVTDEQVVIRLDAVPALRSEGTAFVLGTLQMIVLRLAGSDYRAFTNVCTHSGCGIGIFEAARMKCQCHGSEFDTDGRNVAGPAPAPLARYQTTFDPAARTLTIQRRA